MYYLTGELLRPLAGSLHSGQTLTQDEIDREVERLALESSPEQVKRAEDYIEEASKHGLKVPEKAKELSVLGQAQAVAADKAKHEREQARMQTGDDGEDDVVEDQVGDRNLLPRLLPYLVRTSKIKQVEAVYGDVVKGIRGESLVAAI